MEMFHPLPHEIIPEPPKAHTEEGLIILALNHLVHTGEMTEDAKQECLNKLIDVRLATAHFDMLFFPILTDET